MYSISTWGIKTCIWTALLIISPEAPAQQDTVRIVFYNTENLYDPFNDTLTMDDDFLPCEPRAWTYSKFRTKVFHIARALVAAGQWQRPAIIGLCEVENRFVLKQLTEASPLKKTNYHIIHEDSPDPRGVDVALLYDPEQFMVIQHKALRMTNPRDSIFKTRDILYIKGTVRSGDTLHLFVNHWPSKYGGLASSLLKRKFVAAKLRGFLDSLFSINSRVNIMLMGDFNDGPEQEVMQEMLEIHPGKKQAETFRLYNLMEKFPGKQGTHKFHGEWSVLDQFLVSGSLLDGNLSVSSSGARAVKANFLLEEDENYSGHKPFRTFAGPRYLGGYSDHLPVVVDLLMQHSGK